MIQDTTHKFIANLNVKKKCSFVAHVCERVTPGGQKNGMLLHPCHFCNKKDVGYRRFGKVVVMKLQMRPVEAFEAFLLCPRECFQTY